MSQTPYQEIEIEKLIPSKQNYRRTFDKKELDELIESVMAKGIIQPIIVRPLKGNGSFEIVAGHRRHSAATTAKLKTMPAIVKEYSDEEALEVQVIENSHREDPNPIDEAFGFKRLIELGRHTPETLAEKLGKSVKYVLGRIKIGELPKEACDKLISGEILLGHALALTRLKDPEKQKELLEEMTDGVEHMSVAEALDWAKDYDLKLAGAIFNKKECAKCNYSSRNQAVLFPEDEKGDEYCLSRKCYVDKTREYYKALLADKKKAGFVVLTDIKKVAKTSTEIVSSGGDFRTTVPLKYKSQCMKCFDKHAFYFTEDKEFRRTDFKFGERCLDTTCLKKMNKVKPSPATSSSSNGSNDVSSEAARDCRDTFLQKIMPAKVEASEVIRKRLVIYVLLREYDHCDGAEQALKDHLSKGTVKVLFERDIYRTVAKVKKGKLDSLLKAILMAIAPDIEPQVLLEMTPEAKVDMVKHFTIDEEYLKSRTKWQLLELVKELWPAKKMPKKIEEYFGFTTSASGSEPSLPLTCKKPGMISLILAEKLKGRVPGEIKKICKVGK